MQLTLVIGSRNVSSWSLRPWLALRQGGVPFDEVVVPLRRPDTAARIAEWSPSGKVPVLLVDGSPVWDSLAICELAAELAPDLWPSDPLTRAHARSVSAEMHAGFSALRTFLPMDFVGRFGPPGRLLSGVARDLARIEAMWVDCRERYAADGPFLFGRFSVADAMYAPVVSRLLTYGIEQGPEASAYTASIRALPGWAEWAAAAAQEDEPGPARDAVAASPAALPRDAMPMGQHLARPGYATHPAGPKPGYATDPAGPKPGYATHPAGPKPGYATDPAGPRPGYATDPAGRAGAPFAAGPRSLAAGQPQPGHRDGSGRAPISRAGEIKPIGDGIHRRR